MLRDLPAFSGTIGQWLWLRNPKQLWCRVRSPVCHHLCLCSWCKRESQRMSHLSQKPSADSVPCECPRAKPVYLKDSFKMYGFLLFDNVCDSLLVNLYLNSASYIFFFCKWLSCHYFVTRKWILKISEVPLHMWLWTWQIKAWTWCDKIITDPAAAGLSLSLCLLLSFHTARQMSEGGNFTVCFITIKLYLNRGVCLTSQTSYSY